jgi:hypothetical protein
MSLRDISKYLPREMHSARDGKKLMNAPDKDLEIPERQFHLRR